MKPIVVLIEEAARDRPRRDPVIAGIDAQRAVAVHERQREIERNGFVAERKPARRQNVEHERRCERETRFASRSHGAERIKRRAGSLRDILAA
jgi:hypothetical protein